MNVHVVIDGPRVRTLMDHIFSNASGKALTGTFECSLPEGESPSYFAVFPDDDRSHPKNKSPRPANIPTLPSPDAFVKRISVDCWGEPRRAVVVRAPGPTDPLDVPL